MKSFVNAPPLLRRPGESLYLYLSILKEVAASVLIREQKVKQFLVYYVSKTLKRAEVRYSKLEKLVFALVTSARQLRQYIEAHHIIVRTDQPLLKVLQKAKTLGRIV